jgi:hypothetical protein
MQTVMEPGGGRAPRLLVLGHPRFGLHASCALIHNHPRCRARGSGITPDATERERQSERESEGESEEGRLRGKQECATEVP